MNTLVVGGAGYIGGAVTDLLLQADVPFRVYDSLLYEDHYLKPVPFVQGDIQDDVALRAQLEWADCVIWLAALVGDGACQINPTASIILNQDRVQFLADNFRGRILFTSTCSVYGANDSLLTERSSVRPLSVYASTKLAAERALRDSNALIYRLGTVAGVSDTYSRLRLDLVANIMTLNAIQNDRISVFGGDQWRPMIHVKDVAAALVSQIAPDGATGIFNLATANMRMLELAEMVKEITGCTKLEVTDMPTEDKRNYRVSTDSLVNTTGWSPIYLIEDAIQQIATIVGEGRLKASHNIRYSNARHLTAHRSTIDVCY